MYVIAVIDGVICWDQSQTDLTQVVCPEIAHCSWNLSNLSESTFTRPAGLLLLWFQSWSHFEYFWESEHYNVDDIQSEILILGIVFPCCHVGLEWISHTVQFAGSVCWNLAKRL